MEADGEFSEEVKRERELAKIRQVLFSLVGNVSNSALSSNLVAVGQLNDSTSRDLITILGTS